MLSLKCPHCGGTIYFEKEDPISFCQFCGSHLTNMDGYVSKAVEFEFTKQEHNMNMETMEKEIKQSKINAFSNTTTSIVEIIKYTAAIIAIGAVVYFFVSLINIIKH